MSAGATSAATLVSSSGAADISTTTTAAATTAATARAAELVMHQDRVAEIMALVFGARQREQVQEQQVTQDVSGRGSGGNNVDDASRINVSMNLGSASSDYRGDSEDSDSYYEASQGSSGSDNYPEEMTEESSGSSDVDEEDVQQIAMEAGSSAQQRVPASENSHAQLVVTEENTTNDAGNFLESNQSLALEFW